MDRSPWKTKKKMTRAKKKNNGMSGQGRGISEGSFERQRGVTLCLFFVGNSNVNELFAKLWRIPNSIQPRTRYLTQASSLRPQISPTHIYLQRENVVGIFQTFFFIERSCILYSSIHRHLFGIVSIPPLYKK